MIKKIKFIIATFSLSFAVLGLGTVPAYAACPASGTPKDQVLQGVGQTGGNCDDSGIPNVVGNIITILSYIVGVAAIIMIIWAGFRYITSGGDSNKVSQAKNTLIYALVGVVIAILAQALVNFAITTGNDAQNTGQNTSKSKSKNP